MTVQNKFKERKTYNFELWNGKTVVGHIPHSLPPLGVLIIFDRKDNRGRFIKIRVPLMVRVVEENATDRLLRVCLDVRKKSKNQIKLILNYDAPCIN